MRWASAVSDKPVLEQAVRDCADLVRNQLGGCEPDLAIVFVSIHHAESYLHVPVLLRHSLPSKMLFGCSAGGVIGGGQEVEHRPGFSLTAAILPDVELIPSHVENNQLPDLDASPQKWEELVNSTTSNSPSFLILADPFTFQAENLLMGLDYAFPGSVKVGGLASGAHRGGANSLYLNRDVFRSGAVVLAMHGNVAVKTIVAQGCRPIGTPMRVTKCQRNWLIELDDRRALEVAAELFHSLNERDKELFRESLFLGIGMDKLRTEYRQGDFLIRNIIGVDRESSSLAIGELLSEGQIVQFHLRDAITSAEDLRTLLSRYANEAKDASPYGALLFSCLGRGMYLYNRPNHDTDMFRQLVGNLPLSGFFCNGEIGPVQGSTYLHGYTSSFGLFRPKNTQT